MGKMMVEKEVKKRNVIVGIGFDNESKELLSWAIVKVSDPGDRVVAVRVCRNSDEGSKEKPLLDSFLEIYKELCHIKMVGLTGVILTGKSIRRTVVNEAKNQDAIAVLVGTSKQATLGGWLSTAKYCAKHLPSSTQVLTVHNGKVAFKSGFTDQQHKGLMDPKPSFHTRRRPSLNEINSDFGDSETSELTTITTTTDTQNSPRLANFLELERRDSSTSSNGSNSGELLPEMNPNQCHSNSKVQQEAFIRSASSLQTETIPENRPIGWPLLRKHTLPTQTALDARKMSVVQWVLTLPDRSSNDPSSSSCSCRCSGTCVCDSCSSKPGSPLVGRRKDSNGSSISEGIVNSGIQKCLSGCSEIPADELGLLPSDSRSSDFTWFSFDVLGNSTSQFSSENLIGNGGCSKVYKGKFRDGKQVAVRVIKSSKEAWKDFSLEVNIISSLKHTNISPLLGVCVEDNKLISVYEFKSGGNLEENLHGTDTEKFVLPWEARYKIAVGVAEALNYLHNESSKPVIHRDVKSSNILLSDGFEPQLSDFGLAIWGPTSSSFETYDDVVGTFGYLAPEYFMYGKVSDKIDVYSYGVVLLELLTGRKPIDSGSKNQESLVMWAKPIMETGDVRTVLDSNLKENFGDSQMQRMALAAALCLTTAARFRPNMSKVLELLKGEEPIENWKMTTQKFKDVKSDELGVNDDEVYADSSAHSHLNLALQDVDDYISCSSVEQHDNVSLGEYMKDRCSRSSSFD